MLSICKNTRSAFEGTVISHFSENKITKNNTSVPKRYTYVKSGSTDLGTEKLLLLSKNQECGSGTARSGFLQKYPGFTQIVAKPCYCTGNNLWFFSTKVITATFNMKVYLFGTLVLFFVILFSEKCKITVPANALLIFLQIINKKTNYLVKSSLYKRRYLEVLVR